MSPGQILRFALAGLAANKLRSALTTLGILIGVGSVILLVAVGNGSSRQIEENLDALGTNSLTVLHEGAGLFGSASGNTGATSTANLTVADAQALSQAAGVASACEALSTSAISAGMRARADSAVPASPTTTMSGSASSRSRTPFRTISWSSSRNTPICPLSRVVSSTL